MGGAGLAEEDNVKSTYCILCLLILAVLTSVLIGCSSSGGGGTGQIAFQRGSSIFIMNGDGTNVRQVFATGTQPSLRTDGKVVAFVSGNDIFTVNTDGSGLKQVTQNGVGVTVSNPAFSPNGSRIAFAVSDLAPAATTHINAINTDGTGLFTIVGDADEPTWSPGGDQIAFIRNGEIFLVNIDGSGLTNLTMGNAGIAPSHPSFSPSGAEIAFSAAPSTISPPNIRVLALGNGQISDIISNGIQPSFGPGGLNIAFVRGGAIFSINISGTSLVQLTGGPTDLRPSWNSSP